MEKEIYLIRHGETDLNKKNIVQGRGVDSDLNAIGKAQGAAFYKAYHHVAFDKIYISNLKRTEQSVALFIEQGIPFEKNEGLDELAWGIWEGKESSPESSRAFKNVLGQWRKGDFDAKFKDGESPIDVCKRQKPVIEKIKKDSAKNILICMHGRAMRMFLCQLLEVSLQEMDQFVHSNLTLYRLHYDGQKFHLLERNNTDHLTYFFAKK